MKTHYCHQCRIALNHFGAYVHAKRKHEIQEIAAMLADKHDNVMDEEIEERLAAGLKP